MDLIKTTRTLADDLHALRRPAGVSHVYNPLRYMWPAHERFLLRHYCVAEPERRFGPDGVGLEFYRPAFSPRPRRYLILGMNPGPHGMVQTGLPFGDVVNAAAMLGYKTGDQVPAPDLAGVPLHPRRPIVGLTATRREASGERLWGGLASIFGGLDQALAGCFAANYCPLAYFADDAQGTNITPEDFGKKTINGKPNPRHDPGYAAELDKVCLPYLVRVARAMRVEVILAVGRYAEAKANIIAALCPEATRRCPSPKVVYLTHPSPLATRSAGEWATMARHALENAGVLPPGASEVGP